MNKSEMLETLRIYMFCAVDLKEYLDNFPEEKNAVEDYQILSAKILELKKDYESKYGPICNTGMSEPAKLKTWTEEPWPWERVKKED